MLTSFTTSLNHEFAIKDPGDLSYFLGLEVTYTNDGLFLSQAKYAKDILIRANFLDSKPVSTPLATNKFFLPLLVSWSVKKQSTVSRSSCESEYRAMANTAAEIVYITHLLQELHALPPDRPTLLYDDKSALFMSQNPVSHKRAKHIDLDYHFVKELVASGKLYTKFIPAKLQVSDIFTKSLPRPHDDLAALDSFAVTRDNGRMHMFLANTSVELVQHSVMTRFIEDLNIDVGKPAVRSKSLWKKVRSLEVLQPYANPRSKYPAPVEQSNGFIYAKIFGEFEKIRSSICDLVAISRLLNATLVIPEIQDSTTSKGISSEFKSFSYLYNEEQFITSLKNDVIIVKSLPPKLKEARKRKELLTFKPKKSASPDYYIKEVLPELTKSKVIGLVVMDGGCLQ
ncbi:embryo sac development arrest 30-like protein isoform X1, partial [Tanacetum coccineum]